MSKETREVSVGITVKAEIVSRIKDKSFTGSPFEITPNTLESSFMRCLWTEGVAHTDGLQRRCQDDCVHTYREAVQRYWRS